MVPAVYAALKARWEQAGKPEVGWMFPTGSREGHLNKDTAKDQHKKAIERAYVAAKKEGAKEIPFFQPYILRHTALTQLANSGCDVFTLARIAGTLRSQSPNGTSTHRQMQLSERFSRPGI